MTQLLEQSAADGVPIRGLVGDDPADFMETSLDTYRGAGKSWAEKERQRLATGVDDAIQEQGRHAEQ